MSTYTRNFLFALGATVIWFFIMRPFTPPNIVAFELAGSVEAAHAIITNEGPDWVDQVITGIYLDFGFILIYCSTFMFACQGAGNFSRVPFFTRVSRNFVVFIWIAGLCDGIENIALLNTLSTITQTSVSIAFYTATVKFSILLLALVFVLICVVTGLFTRKFTN